jgi:type II restriction enzyme
MDKRDFGAWMSKFRDSISDYSYYVDFAKVHRNVDSVKIEMWMASFCIHSRS